MIHIIPVDSPELLHRTATVACVIWTEHYPPLIGRAQVDYMLEHFHSEVIMRQQINEGMEYYLVTEEEGDMGYFSVQYRERDLFLSKFYLEKGARGKGHSREMLSVVEALAFRKGLKRITLNTHKRNAIAIRAYEGLGFRIVGPVLTDIGEGYVMDDYQLEKLI
jgi:RimJ/RimL family protein N-acetyltransferase